MSSDNASIESTFGTRVPDRSSNPDSLGLSKVPPSTPFRVIAVESCETRWAEAGSNPTAPTILIPESLSFSTGIHLGVPKKCPKLGRLKAGNRGAFRARG